MTEQSPPVLAELRAAIGDGDVRTVQAMFESILDTSDTSTVPGLITEEKRSALCSVLDRSSEEVATLYASRPNILVDDDLNDRDEIYHQGQQFDHALTGYAASFDSRITGCLQPTESEPYEHLKHASRDQKQTMILLKRALSDNVEAEDAKLTELGWYTRSALLEMLQEARQAGRDFAHSSRNATDSELTDNLHRWRDDISDCFVHIGNILDLALDEVEN